MTDNYVESESNSPSIMHDRVVVIWAVEIVCHLFPEVMYVLCQNPKNKTPSDSFCEKSTDCN